MLASQPQEEHRGKRVQEREILKQKPIQLAMRGLRMCRWERVAYLQCCS